MSSLGRDEFIALNPFGTIFKLDNTGNKVLLTEQEYEDWVDFSTGVWTEIDYTESDVRYVNADGDVISGNLSIDGTLTVSGSTTTINSTVITVNDPIITLGGGATPSFDDNKDRGIEFHWHDGSSPKVGFFGYDDSTGKFTFIPDSTNSSEVFSGTKGVLDAVVEWSNISDKPDPIVTVTLTGDVTGTANGTLSDLGNASISVDATIVDDSHNHIISNVDGLQDALDAKQPSATSLTTSTSFGGDVSGTYNAIVISDDSHNHIISNIDGLESALSAKLDASTYTAADILNKIKTVDGSGSGLDADTLDGQNGSYYLDWTNISNKPDPTITVTLTGDVTGTSNATLTDLGNGTVTISTTVVNGGGGTFDHGNLQGLGDDDHTQYLLADGTRTATELNVSGDLTVDTDTLHVDSTNNRVGIGTTTPDSTLQVNGIAKTGDLTVVGDGLGESTILIDPNNGTGVLRRGSGYFDILALNAAETGYDPIYLNGLVATITGTGVGIGTTSPTVPLDVVGDVNITTASGDGYLQVLYQAIDTALYANLTASGQMDAQEVSLFAQNPNTETSVPLRLTGSTVHVVGDFNVDQDTLFVDSTNNRVGIGTTAPSSWLEIHVNSPEIRLTNDAVSVNSDFYYAGVTMRDSSENLAGAIGFISGEDQDMRITSYRAGASLHLVTGGASNNRITITDTGNVGIGTTSPSVSLDVSGTARFTSASVTSATASSSLLRNITLSTSAPTGGNDGDVWMVYS